MKNAWQILGIEVTENKRVIKKAYAAKLAKYHPEEYPEEFKEIQDAYQSIIDSLSREYTENLPRVNLKEAFKRKTNIYDVQEISEILDEKKDIEKKIDNNSLYDELNLDWSFKNIDAKNKEQDSFIEKETLEVDIFEEVAKEVKVESVNFEIPNKRKASKQEDDVENFKRIKTDNNPYNKKIIEETNLDLNDLYYEKFKERLQYSKSIYNMQELILNSNFYQQMFNIDFYHKISLLVIENIATFDSLVLSFLYDAFWTICDNNKYPMDTAYVPVAIKNYRKKVIKKARINKFMTNASFVVIIVLIAVGAIFSTANKKQEEQREKEVIENIQQSFQTQKDEQKKTDQQLILKEVQKQYPEVTECMIMAEYTKETRPLVMTIICSTVVEEDVMVGTAYFNEDGKLDHVSVTATK